MAPRFNTVSALAEQDDLVDLHLEREAVRTVLVGPRLVVRGADDHAGVALRQILRSDLGGLAEGGAFPPRRYFAGLTLERGGDAEFGYGVAGWKNLCLRIASDVPA